MDASRISAYNQAKPVWNMRSAGRIIFDICFISIHIGKWVAGIYVGTTLYKASPGGFWAIIFLILGGYILQDLYKVFKAVIKDTTLDELDSEGDGSYLKGIDPLDLRAAKAQIFVYLFVFTIAVAGITNNFNQWKEDGQNRVWNIAILSLFAAAPVAGLIGKARKRD